MQIFTLAAHKCKRMQEGNTQNSVRLWLRFFHVEQSDEKCCEGVFVSLHVCLFVCVGKAFIKLCTLWWLFLLTCVSVVFVHGDILTCFCFEENRYLVVVFCLNTHRNTEQSALCCGWFPRLWLIKFPSFSFSFQEHRSHFGTKWTKLMFRFKVVPYSQLPYPKNKIKLNKKAWPCVLLDRGVADSVHTR